MGYARDMNTVVITHVMVSQAYNQTNIQVCSPCGLQSTRAADALLRLFSYVTQEQLSVCFIYRVVFLCTVLYTHTLR